MIRPGYKYSGVPVDPREAKLPQWAQRQIEQLRMRLDEAREKLAGIPRADAVAFTDPFSDYQLPVAKMRDTVRFYVSPSRGWIDVRMREDGNGRYLEVMTSNRTNITPHASNLIEVRIEEL